jgi:hypothetical protein
MLPNTCCTVEDLLVLLQTPAANCLLMTEVCGDGKALKYCIYFLARRRGAQMFRKVHVPLLGLVENMSHYCCPNCGHQDTIFGSGGVAAAADDLGVELLGQVGRLILGFWRY